MGYVLYSPINSFENLPPFRASTKDGYAMKYINDGHWSQKSNIFNVVQVSVAGTIVSVYFIFDVISKHGISYEILYVTLFYISVITNFL